MNQDFIDLLQGFVDSEVAFLVVGAFALAVHGVARATGDIDVWVRPDPDNAQRVMRALAGFGAPISAHGVTVMTFSSPGALYQLGLPPRRIDILTHVDGLTFAQAWPGRASAVMGGVAVPVLGLADLRTNKLAAGRPKDLLDLALLDERMSIPGTGRQNSE